jgi:phosphoenolpyruvate---glycerone phosphotransferase subunit DhaL
MLLPNLRSSGSERSLVNGATLVALLDATLVRLAESRDELRDLDAALGDGDLGVTISKGCEAVRRRLGEVAEPAPAEVLRAAGAAFASANPSTMAALVGGALLAGAKAVAASTDLDGADVIRFARAAADSIATRGKAELGDKTMLDAILPSVDALEAAADSGASDTMNASDALDAMVAAARRAVDETAPLQSRRGRAAWLGERSAGNPDPGATAYLRLLEALTVSWPSLG